MWYLEGSVEERRMWDMIWLVTRRRRFEGVGIRSSVGGDVLVRARNGMLRRSSLVMGDG